MVADLNASDNCLDVVPTQRGFIGTQFFTHQLGEALDKLGRDSAFRVCELALEHDDIGLNMDKLFGQFAMLLGEARVGGREMPVGYEIEQAIDPGLEMRLAGLELPQLLAPRLDRLGGEIEPRREEIAQPLGNQEALLDRIKDDVVELRPSDATALADARASSRSVGAAIILVPSPLAGDCRHSAAAAVSAATASETDEKIVRGRYARGRYRRTPLDETALNRFEIISRDDRRNRNGNPLTFRTLFTCFGIALVV